MDIWKAMSQSYELAIKMRNLLDQSMSRVIRVVYGHPNQLVFFQTPFIEAVNSHELRELFGKNVTPSQNDYPVVWWKKHFKGDVAKIQQEKGMTVGEKEMEKMEEESLSRKSKRKGRRNH